MQFDAMSAVSQAMLDSLPLPLVETLFESAHEAIDCAGMAFWSLPS